MVNAWSLAASILDGTFDKDYPIMTEKTGNININTGVGNTVTYNVTLTDTNLNGDITIGSGSTMTYDQMVSAGYEMSGEGIWWPPQDDGNININTTGIGNTATVSISDDINHFEVMGLPRSFEIDSGELERLYQSLTLEIHPEYLKISNRNINNYKDWSIQLGRRFRALKLWFVIRTYGINGIKKYLRSHIELAKYLYKCMIFIIFD